MNKPHKKVLRGILSSVAMLMGYVSFLLLILVIANKLTSPVIWTAYKLGVIRWVNTQPYIAWTFIGITILAGFLLFWQTINFVVIIITSNRKK